MRMTSTLALLAALVAACGAPAAKTPPDPSALVTTAAVTRENLPEIVSGFGSIEFDPASQHTLNAEIEARVIDILAVSGDSVDKGQVILRLGPSSTTGLDLVRFRRDATAAQAVLERTQRLRKDGLASDADVEAAAATARDLDLQASSLEARTGSVSMLRSPIAGIVDALLVEPGDLVAPGAQMVRVASADAIQARPASRPGTQSACNLSMVPRRPWKRSFAALTHGSILQPAWQPPWLRRHRETGFCQARRSRQRWLPKFTRTPSLYHAKLCSRTSPVPTSLSMIRGRHGYVISRPAFRAVTRLKSCPALRRERPSSWKGEPSCQMA